MGLPDCYIYWMPEPTPRIRNAIKTAYQMLKSLDGYEQLPLLCQVDFRWLKEWVGKLHPTSNKLQLILNFLAPDE